MTCGRMSRVCLHLLRCGAAVAQRDTETRGERNPREDWRLELKTVQHFALYEKILMTLGSESVGVYLCKGGANNHWEDNAVNQRDCKRLPSVHYYFSMFYLNQGTRRYNFSCFCFFFPFHYSLQVGNFLPHRHKLIHNFSELWNFFLV